jgi:hypothetical protein
LFDPHEAISYINLIVLLTTDSDCFRTELECDTPCIDFRHVITTTSTKTMFSRSTQAIIRRPVLPQIRALPQESEMVVGTARFVRRVQPQPQPQQRRNYFKNNAKDEPIRPYSDSLPSPGYEWCSRCQIRTHKFQKPLGQQNNGCLEAPRLFGLGVCGSARQYYQQQVTHMIFLSLFCFAAAPLYNATQTQEKDE